MVQVTLPSLKSATWEGPAREGGSVELDPWGAKVARGTATLRKVFQTEKVGRETRRM